MKKLYKFYCDFGRMGSLEGVFVKEESDIKSIIGKEVYFGECLGKHSEVYLTIEKKHLQELSDNLEVIKVFEENIGTVGYSPFDYLDECSYHEDDQYEEEDSEDDEE